jgi:EF-hand domain pair
MRFAKSWPRLIEGQACLLERTVTATLSLHHAGSRRLHAPCDLASDFRSTDVQLDADDVHVIMKLVDKDRDGKVSLDDFRKFMEGALSEESSAAASCSAAKPLAL